MTRKQKAKRVSGVYGIRCKATNKWYIGGSLDIERRINDHFRLMWHDARAAREWGDHSFEHMHEMGRDYWKHGREAFECYVLHETKDKLDIAFEESWFVHKYDSLKNGYNSQKAGCNRFWK